MKEPQPFSLSYEDYLRDSHRAPPTVHPAPKQWRKETREEGEYEETWR